MPVLEQSRTLGGRRRSATAPGSAPAPRSSTASRSARTRSSAPARSSARTSPESAVAVGVPARVVCHARRAPDDGRPRRSSPPARQASKAATWSSPARSSRPRQGRPQCPSCRHPRLRLRPAGARRIWRLAHHVSRWAAGAVDQVISLRYPSYAVRHRAHVCWLNHTMREYYDLWPRIRRVDLREARLKERCASGRCSGGRPLAADQQRDARSVAQSQTIQRRLAADLGVDADVLLAAAAAAPVPVRRLRRLTSSRSRGSPRRSASISLIRAHGRARRAPGARRHRRRGRRSARRSSAWPRQLGVADRVTLRSAASTTRRCSSSCARCRAVCFAPLDEDYGFVTVEAFASSKAVVTCTDSGGPAELVRDGGTGLMCDPTAIVAGHRARAPRRRSGVRRAARPIRVERRRDHVVARHDPAAPDRLRALLTSLQRSRASCSYGQVSALPAHFLPCQVP